MEQIFLKIISQMFRSFLQILLFHLKSEIRLELKLKSIWNCWVQKYGVGEPQV